MYRVCSSPCAIDWIDNDVIISYKLCGFKMKRSQSRKAQQELRLRRGHGGVRPGAGRKPKNGRRRVAHARRPVVKRSWPMHVTVRVRRDVPRLRNFDLAKALRQAFVKGCQKPGFGI